jgi:hypothetical protein
LQGRAANAFFAFATSPHVKPILRDLISGILGISVVRIKARNVELPISDISEKCERLDVNCAADGNRRFDVEMQTELMSVDNTDSAHKYEKPSGL